MVITNININTNNMPSNIKKELTVRRLKKKYTPYFIAFLLAIIVGFIVLAVVGSTVQYGEPTQPAYVIPDACELAVVVCEGEPDYQPLQ